MPYKYRSLGKRRFMAGTGVRFMADGVTVRCHAVRRSVSKRMKRENPNIKTKDLWPEYQCRLAARKGYYVCRWHGAGWEGGPGPGRQDTTVTKKKTDYIKGDLADKYKTFVEDPDIYDMRHTAALLQARNIELIENLSQGALSHPKKIESLYKGLALVKAGDSGGIQIIEEVITSLDGERLAWEEIRKNSTVFKDVTNAEINRVKEMRLSMNAEQVYSIIGRLADLFVKAVTEQVDLPPKTQQQLLSIIDGGVHDIIGTGARTLLESTNNGKR